MLIIQPIFSIDCCHSATTKNVFETISLNRKLFDINWYKVTSLLSLLHQSSDTLHQFVTKQSFFFKESKSKLLREEESKIFCRQQRRTSVVGLNHIIQCTHVFTVNFLIELVMGWTTELYCPPIYDGAIGRLGAARCQQRKIYFESVFWYLMENSTEPYCFGSFLKYSNRHRMRLAYLCHTHAAYTITATNIVVQYTFDFQLCHRFLRALLGWWISIFFYCRLLERQLKCHGL